MMFLIRFWRSLTKKDSVERAEYEIKILVVLQFFDVFFHRSGFSGSDPDFLPIRIRTQKKNPDPKHCINLRNPLGLRISRSLLYPDLLPVHRFGSGKRMQIRIGLVQT